MAEYGLVGLDKSTPGLRVPSAGDKGVVYGDLVVQGWHAGIIETDGRWGVTVTHGRGNLNYIPKVTIIGATAEKAGDLSVVRAANTIVIYNTGDPVTVAYELTGADL